MGHDEVVGWRELRDRGKFLTIILVSGAMDLGAIIAWVALASIGQRFVHSLVPEGTTYVVPISLLDWLVWVVPGVLVTIFVINDAVRVVARLRRSG